MPWGRLYQVSQDGRLTPNILPSANLRRPNTVGFQKKMLSEEGSFYYYVCYCQYSFWNFILFVLQIYLSFFINLFHLELFFTAGKPAIGGEWSLIDLNGNLVTNKSFEGKWTLLYFGFARCPDICPSEMVKVGQVMDTLAKEYPQLAKNVKPIFVSVDPARDSLKALKEYAKDFHPSYVFLTGSPDQVQQMAKKYRVYVSKADETEDGDYLVDHSIVIYFHDDTGDLADCFTQSMRPSDVVEKVVERMTFVPEI